MKRFLLFVAMLFISLGVFAQYIDLGLSSGTKWRNSNEGGDNVHYTYDEAVSKFGNKLPTKEQLEELKNQCTWTWTGSGYKVVGPNGNSIYFPAAGFRCSSGVYDVQLYGCYWSATEYYNDAYYLLFYSNGAIMNKDTRFNGLSVRLVQD